MEWEVVRLVQIMDGAKFKERRIALGYDTLDAIAKALSIDVEIVRSWESGTQEIPKYAAHFLEREEKRKQPS